MKTIKEKLKAYKKLFKVTMAQTMAEGPEKAWSERTVKKEVLN